ncbi:hypothetical protein [Macrococcus carouselicus]|uniref:Uncharacterized protein n=1 Tax=Macrococcus carouselicus TaxID=69969 RepID=A0A9Q8FPM1_9STAP|nr:hypothetical protein [Macrococcus carouselicus]TDL95514.1 hypothetical protein ERX40_10045 [Macrococcus carouselicus]
MSYTRKIKNKVQLLIDDDTVTGYQIERATGIHAPTVHHLRAGKMKIENMKFKTVMLLFDYYTQIEKQRKKEAKLNEKD